MKLALIRRQFSATGGAELYLQRLIGALAGAGHDLHLFTEGWQMPPKGVTIHEQSVTASRADHPIAFARAVDAALAGLKFDCVFSLERTLRQDVYRAGDGLHRVWLERRREFAPWWRRPFTGLGAFHRNMCSLEAQTLNPANTRHIIVNSDMVRREILAHFPFPEERIHLVRNGVDVDRCQNGRREETRKALGIGNDEFVMLFAGSGWERKGLRYLIRAIEELNLLAVEHEDSDEEPLLPRSGRHLRLLVAGKGKRPASAPDNVTFIGPTDRIEDLYAAADLFTFVPIYEPSSNVVYEALAAGLPVITSAYNGAGEVIQPGVNGTVIASPSDIGALVEAIKHWMTHRFSVPRTDTAALSLERNVTETVRVLELAAAQRA